MESGETQFEFDADDPDAVLLAVRQRFVAGFLERFHSFGLMIDAIGADVDGGPSEALAQLHRAEEGLELLAKRDPADQRFPEDLGLALRTLADHRLEMGDTAGAERDLQRSLGLLEPLYQANSRNLILLRDLADCYQGFGDLSASRSNWRQALGWYQKSLDLWGRWKQVGASSVYDRQRHDLAARLVAQAAKNSSRNSSSP